MLLLLLFKEAPVADADEVVDTALDEEDDEDVVLADEVVVCCVLVLFNALSK